MNILNKSLEKFRLEKELSHKDVAKKAGISRAFYTQIENGNRTPSIGVAKRLSEVLNLSLDDFFYALEVTKRNKSNIHSA